MKIVKRRVNKILNKSLLIGFAIWLIFSIGTGSAQNLTSVNVATAPFIDGAPEAIWDQANATSVNVSGGANTASTTVTLKSVYTDDSVYFLAQWADPTESLRREPWVKQANGSWMQLMDPDDKGGDNNKYYEDKLAQIWNINISGFETTGCFATCHAGEPGKPYGNKYTPNPGEIGDLWHMKIVRTNPTGYIDDQYVDSTRYSNATPDAGRHSDLGLVPYYTNINATRTGPNFTSADQPAPPYWIFDDQKRPFNDIYNAGDEIAGIIVRSPAGDRADIRGKAVYKDGKWSMEYGRKLITGSQYDVQFSDLKKEYLFGTAIFDNAQVRHSYQTGVSKLVFAAPTVTPTPNVTVTAAPKPTRPTEIVNNMTGIPVVNESTINTLAEDYMNFRAGDPYTITITKIADNTVVYTANGTLTGGPKQTIRINWTPKNMGDYILRSEANTIADTKIVPVINQKIIAPIPELSTMALMSVGLLGLFGLARLQRRN